MLKLLISSILLVALGCSGGDDSENYGKYTRTELRYYAYAPPLIPHPVLNPQCLDCHEQGLVVDGYPAPVTPHPEFSNCQQCHIRADDRIEPFRENSFVGMDEPAAIDQPNSLGPPLIPHRLFLRRDCLICHDDPGRDVIQTTHPERENCMQCHIEQNARAATFSSTD